MPQGTMQEPKSCNTEALIVLMAVAQGIFPPLRTYLIEGLLQVKVHDMVIHINHAFFNSNLMCLDLCNAKMTKASMM